MHILRRTFDSNGYVTACRFLLFYFVLFLQAFNKAIHPSTMKISNKLFRTAIWGDKKLAGFLQIKGQLYSE